MTNSTRLLVTATLATLALLLGAGAGMAAHPGQNGQIAFMRSGDIWTMAPDGSNQKRITTEPGGDTEPAVSPDGTKIAFTTSRHGDAEIYVMNADGSGETRLTTSAGFDEQPTFAPDGRIAFTSTRSGRAQIHLMNMDGSNQIQLTNDGWSAGNAEFSPGGDKIVYTKNVFGNTDVFVTSQTTACCTKTGTQLTFTNGTDTAPNYSPDGGSIVFTSARDGNTEIYRMAPDGTGQTRLTTNTAVDNLAAYSPDSQRIAFETSRDGGRDIYTMRPDGSDATRLTDHAGDDQWPDWGTLVDATPPAEPMLTATDPDSPANDNAPRVIGAAEPGSTVRLYSGGSCGGAPAATGSAADLAAGLAIAVVDDSSTTVRATATDEAGNVSGCSASSITYVEDSTAPATSITSGPPAVTSSSTATFAFSSSEPGSSFECRVDAASFAPCSSPHTTAPLANGAHTFEVRATDAAANVDATPANHSFVVCAGAPAGIARALAAILRSVDPAVADTVVRAICR